MLINPMPIDPIHASTAVDSRLGIGIGIGISKPASTQGTALVSDARLPSSSITGRGAAVLHEALRPGIGIAIWQRDLAPAVRDAMAALYALMPLHRLFTLDADEDPAPILDRALIGFGQLPELSRQAWRDDLLGLIAHARGLAPQAAVRVRIETKVNDGCRLFHTDNVPLRMICTYRGPGTQWLPERIFDRAELGRGNNDFVLDWSAVRELDTGDVAVMKGLRFPGSTTDALVHRSPLASPAQPRVVVVIDVLLQDSAESSCAAAADGCAACESIVQTVDSNR
jgi:Protein of unknown function (DUF1826)